jgi:hypothetical protein
VARASRRADVRDETDHEASKLRNEPKACDRGGAVPARANLLPAHQFLEPARHYFLVLATETGYTNKDGSSN